MTAHRPSARSRRTVRASPPARRKPAVMLARFECWDRLEWLEPAAWRPILVALAYEVRGPLPAPVPSRAGARIRGPRAARGCRGSPRPRRRAREAGGRPCSRQTSGSRCQEGADRRPVVVPYRASPHSGVDACVMHRMAIRESRAEAPARAPNLAVSSSRRHPRLHAPSLRGVPCRRSVMVGEGTVDCRAGGGSRGSLPRIDRGRDDRAAIAGPSWARPRSAARRRRCRHRWGATCEPSSHFR